jgi:phosphoglycolate phosphatase
MYCVLFDIDGTLIESGGAGQLAFAEAFAMEFDVDELSGEISFAGRSDRAIALDLMRVHGVEGTQANWQRFSQCYVRRLPETLQARTGRVLPGVTSFLDALDAMPDVHIGLLTGNIPSGARAKLSHYGIYERFAFGGFGDRATDRNEIARQALTAATQYLQNVCDGASAELCGTMVIGDTVHDIRCARAIDAVAVAVPTGHTPAETLAAEAPDLLLEDLEEFPRLLEQIQQVTRQAETQGKPRG